MNRYLTIAFLFCVFNISAQQHLPADVTDSSYAEMLSRSYSSRNEIFLDKLKDETTDKKLAAYYRKNFKAIFKALNERIKEGEMIYIPEISALIEKVFLEVKAKNQNIPEDIQIFLLRENLPNAQALGDNSLFINLGLFYYLESEDQVASVLCHEIGHLMMLHTLKALKYNYENDKEHKEDVFAIRHSETRKAERAFEVLKNSIYKEGKITRHHEMQADSSGYALLRNTDYQKTAFINALEIIERYDTLRLDGVTADAYKHFFDLPDQKFKQEWLQVEDFSSYNYKSFTQKLNDDSVSSHPKTKERIEYLKEIFPELNNEEKHVTGNAAFNEVRRIADKERIPNLFFTERYGEIIYMSLLRLQEHPDDTSAKRWLAKGFQKIYEARKSYRLNRYLERITPEEQTESYIQFLSFMWNLKLEEIERIANFYSQKDQHWY